MRETDERHLYNARTETVALYWGGGTWERESERREYRFECIVVVHKTGNGTVQAVSELDGLPHPKSGRHSCTPELLELLRVELEARTGVPVWRINRSVLG